MNSIEVGKENTFQQLSPRSPNILKPKPLCLKRKPKRLVSSQPLSSLNTNLPKIEGIEVLNGSSPIKCINPFRRIDHKRKYDIDVKDATEESILSQRTNNKIPRSESEILGSHSLSPVVPEDEDANFGFDNKHFAPGSASKNVQQYEKFLPVDWSLKSKIRLQSHKPFPWRTSFKTSEEASGTTGFVRCLHSEDKRSCNLDSSHGAKFYQQALVWMHPAIPWLNLFPRIGAKSSTNSSLCPLESYQQEALHSSWSDSLRSLYQLVRTCQCPFFYLCAPTFTVMFRSSGVGSILDIHAAITPTTRGLRNALKEEGIEFSMPLHQSFGNVSSLDEKSQYFNEDSSVYPENIEIGEDMNASDLENNTEEEPGVWLESLGLSQQDFPSLNPKRAELRKDRRKNVDHRPESLVYVEGPETQVLVNFLLNYSSCMSKTGPMAGIPPTLISPVSFLGATLTSHKVRHNKIRDNNKDLYVVELVGPLLPNTIHCLSSLFNQTQEGDFSSTLSTHAPTTAFSMLLPHTSGVPSVFATENLKDCGLPNPFISQMCSKNESGRVPVTNIVAKDGLFSWS